MKNILVPCDFSKPAVNAFRFALDIAGRSKGIVYLLNVIELPAIHDPIIMPVISFEKEFLNELKEKTSKEFDKIITKYKPDAVEVRTEVSFGAPFRMMSGDPAAGFPQQIIFRRQMGHDVVGANR